MGSNSPVLRYEYTLRDHLGNSRVSFSDISLPAGIEYDDRLQTNTYYPYGSTIAPLSSSNQFVPNDYKYNNKEYIDDLSLNMLDYGARLLDPLTGRWNGVDALAERYHSSSGYGYVSGNPISKIDIGGLGEYYTNDGYYLGSDDIDDHLVYVVDDDYQLARNTNGTIEIGQDGANLLAFNNGDPIYDYQINDVVGTIYAEMGSRDADEAAKIYSTVENLASDRGHTELSELQYIQPGQTKPGIRGWLAKDKYTSEKGKMADEKRSAAFRGFALAAISDFDFSMGARFWQGNDMARIGSFAYNEYYLKGLLFTDATHDIHGLGSNPYQGSRTFSDKRGMHTMNWTYKYQTTTVGGQTTFLKLNIMYQIANRYKKNF
jgi:RHS repeat-associated protein